MGFKSILSIVTVHALNSINIKSNEEVAEVLRHSLLCAFISKRIAISSGIDPEEAFVCGLLHDIGKTVLLNLLEEYSLPREARYKIVNEYHLNTGSLIAIKWNFSEIVKYAIRFHHNPEDALAHVKTVEAVALANAMANEPENGELGEMKFKSLNVKEIDVNQIRKEIGDIQKTVKSLI
jgi:putative nucleotidyltransferase with HDIG domain